MRSHFIEILDIPSNFPAHLLDNGRLYLDLSPEFGFRLNKSRSELSEVDKIKDESALTIVLPRTPKNDLVFASFILPNTPTALQTFNVMCAYGGMILAQNIGIPIRLNDADQTIEFQLAKSQDFWLKAAADFNIDQIDLGRFTYTKANIKATWDKGKFTDGDQGVVLTNIDFGQPSTDEDGNPTDWRIAYFRPLVSLINLLKLGFYQIGYELQFDALETDWGRSLWCYLLKKEFWDQPGRGFLYRTRIRSNDFDGGENGTLYIVEYDNGSNFDATVNSNNGAYVNNQLHTAEISIKFIYPFFAQPYTGTSIVEETVRFYHYRNVNNPEKIDEQFIDFEVDPTDLQDIEYKSKIFTLLPGDYLYVQLDEAHEAAGYLNSFFYIPRNTKIEFVPEGKMIYEGDTVTIRQMLAPYSLLDVFKGAIGLGRFLIETDVNNRKVIVRPKLNTSIDSQAVEGFLQSDFLDLSEKIVVRSRVRQSKAQNNRYAVFAFKKSTDRFIGGLDFNEEENPIYSRSIDLGIGERQTTFIRNSFFEPTANIEYQELEIPAMYDNESGNESYNIAPRILSAVGRFKQVKSFSELVQPATWTWEQEEEDEFLIMSQLPQRQYLDANNNLVEPDQGVVYGGQVEDLFNTFIQSAANELVASSVDQYLVWLSLNDYLQINFRKPLLMYYEGQTFVAELIAVKDYDTSADLPTIIECKPQVAEDIMFNAADYYLDLTRSFYQNVYAQGGGLFMTITFNGELLANSVDMNNYDPIDIPLPLNCFQNEPTNYKNVASIINGLNLGSFYAQPSSRSLCPTPGSYNQNYKYHRLSYISTAVFEIIFQIKTSSPANTENFARWTNTLNQFWDGTAWVTYTTSNIFESGAEARIQIA